MLRALLIALPFALALSSPAAAIGFCNDTNGSSGIRVEFGVQFGSDYTEEDIATFDKMQLRRRGIDATSVERWNGCLRAWVRGEDGRVTQQFYDPNTFERIPTSFTLR